MHNHITGCGGLNSCFSMYFECSWCWTVCFICFNGITVLRDQMITESRLYGSRDVNTGMAENCVLTSEIH